MPRKTVLELSKLLADSDEPVSIELSANQARVQLRRDRAGVQAGRRQVPRLHARHPDQHKNRLQIDREPLRQALQRAAILSNEKFRGVRWVLGEGSLKIVSHQHRAGGGAGGAGGQVLRRRARHRIQRQLPARCAEQCATATRSSAPSAIRPRARSITYASREGLQVRRHADEDLSGVRTANSNRATRGNEPAASDYGSR